MIFYEPTAALLRLLCFFFCGYEMVGWVGTVFPMPLRLVRRRRSEGLWECCVRDSLQIVLFVCVLLVVRFVVWPLGALRMETLSEDVRQGGPICVSIE
jgi:hypothetical protein